MPGDLVYLSRGCDGEICNGSHLPASVFRHIVFQALPGKAARGPEAGPPAFMKQMTHACRVRATVFKNPPFPVWSLRVAISTIPVFGSIRSHKTILHACTTPVPHLPRIAFPIFSPVSF